MRVGAAEPTGFSVAPPPVAATVVDVSDRCVTTKLYVSGRPVLMDRQSVWMASPTGPVRVKSWKQLPSSPTPVVVTPVTSPPPTVAQILGDDPLPDGAWAGSASSYTAKGRKGRDLPPPHPAVSGLTVSADSKAALTQLITSPPSGHGVLISAPPGAGALDAALAVARELTDTASLYLATPSADRWTVEEIDDRIRHPANLRAAGERRPVIIVQDADAMTPTAADRMLKTLEEPPSGALFILTATRPSTMRKTVLGRVTSHVRLTPMDEDERVDLYEQKGLDSLSASQLENSAGENVALALAAIEAGKVGELVSGLSLLSVDAEAPVTRALRAWADLAPLAKQLAPHMFSGQLDSADDDAAATSERQVKAASRLLARHIIDRATEDLRRLVHSAVSRNVVVNVDQVEAAVAGAATEARQAVDAYSPPDRVLVTFFARISPVVASLAPNEAA